MKVPLLEPFEGDVAAALAALQAELDADPELAASGVAAAGTARILGRWGGGAEGPAAEGPPIVFVAENLKLEAAASGRVLVPDAAALFDKALEAMKLPAGAAWLTHAVPYAKPGDARLAAADLERGTRYLHAQLRVLRPAVIVALGARATTALTGLTGIVKLRGKWLAFSGFDPPTPVMPTFHPSYVLKSYTRDNRQKSWDDLQAARAKWADA